MTMKYQVCFRMVCNGTAEVEAESLEEAVAKVRELPASVLGGEADDAEVEIVGDDGE
jgi:hypothetical protein